MTQYAQYIPNKSRTLHLGVNSRLHADDIILVNTVSTHRYCNGPPVGPIYPETLVRLRSTSRNQFAAHIRPRFPFRQLVIRYTAQRRKRSRQLGAIKTRQLGYFTWGISNMTLHNTASRDTHFFEHHLVVAVSFVIGVQPHLS